MTTPSTNSQQTTRDVYYSIGIDQSRNLKERLAELHDGNSEVIKAVAELDRYIGDPQTRISPWYWNFYKKVKSSMSTLYPHADSVLRTQMAKEFIDDIFNGGYVRALQSLSMESGAKYACFAGDYAQYCGVSIGAALLFGPKGAGATELSHFLTAEKLHGIHRSSICLDPRLSQETKNRWYAAQRSCNWPKIQNAEDEQLYLDVPSEKARLPDGAPEALRDMWRRNAALRDYTGTNRLSGDIPYHIVEDVLDVLVQKKFSPLDEIHKARYNQIIEQANEQGIDPFYAVYKNLFSNKERLRPLWDKARKWLYDYSMLLWESQNELWLAEGKRVPASGVVYKSRKTTVTKSKKRAYLVRFTSTMTAIIG